MASAINAGKDGRRFLRLQSVKYQTGLGRTAIYDAVKAGEFPAPVKIGTRAVAWDSLAVDMWMASKLEAARIGGGK